MDAPAAALCYDGRMRIDAHVKAFPDSVRQRRDDYLGRDLTFRSMYGKPETKLGSLGDLLQSMDRNGIDRACLVSIGWSAQEHCVEINDFILEAAVAHPERIVPFCVVNPLAGREAAREVERCAALGARGVGELHPDTQGFDLADRHALEPVMDAARAHGMPVLTHASEPVGHLYPGKGNQRPETLLTFATNFPGATIVMAHWGGGLPFYALMPEVREALADVYFDTAATPFLYDPRGLRDGRGPGRRGPHPVRLRLSAAGAGARAQAARRGRARRGREGRYRRRQRGATVRTPARRLTAQLVGEPVSERGSHLRAL